MTGRCNTTAISSKPSPPCSGFYPLLAHFTVFVSSRQQRHMKRFKPCLTRQCTIRNFTPARPSELFQRRVSRYDINRYLRNSNHITRKQGINYSGFFRLSIQIEDIFLLHRQLRTHHRTFQISTDKFLNKPALSLINIHIWLLTTLNTPREAMRCNNVIHANTPAIIFITNFLDREDRQESSGHMSRAAEQRRGGEKAVNYYLIII